MPRTIQLALALLLVAITFFLAALQIPHIGEGAPDWHTVKKPQIPVESVNEGDQAPSPPPDPENPDSLPIVSGEHPPIAIRVTQAVCVSEPVYGWRWNKEKKQWYRAYLGTHAVTKYISKTVTAYWVVTLHCDAFYDNYGRLRSLPDYR